jgi:hypothetical protein
MQSEASVQSDAAAKVRFDHYELVRSEGGDLAELGHGAIGVTCKAFDTFYVIRSRLK